MALKFAVKRNMKHSPKPNKKVLNMKTANQTNAPKLAIIDNSIAFFSPVERFAEKVIEVAGNEPARLCHPHAYVSNGFLHVVASDTKNNVKAIHGVTLLDQKDASYHTVANGWYGRTRELYQLADGAEFVLNGKHYIYHAYQNHPLWVEAGYPNGEKTRYTIKRRFESNAELQAWREKTGFAVNVIRFLPPLKKRHTKVNMPANAPLAVRRPRSPLVAI